MIVYKSGDILNATEDIICHQVNVDGIMGGGLALQIAKSYPNVEEKYKEYCKENLNVYEILQGESLNIKINDDKEIANCFTQKPNFDTDYRAIYECFTTLLMICKKSNKTIAVPYGYGSGIANGDWKVVASIFKELSEEYQVDISIYKLEN